MALEESKAALSQLRRTAQREYPRSSIGELEAVLDEASAAFLEVVAHLDMSTSSASCMLQH